MTRMQRALFTALAVVGTAPAWAQTRMAGISLGAPVNLDECPQRQGDYLPEDRSACFKFPGGYSTDHLDHHPPADGQIIVNVALSDRPAFMAGSDAVVELKQGMAQSISVHTHGPGQDNSDFRALQDIFGRASPRYLSTAQRYKVYANMRADWQLDDGVTVYFSSAEFGEFSGLVRLQTTDAPSHQPGLDD